MANLPLLTGLTLILAGGTSLAAGFGAFDDWAGDNRECAWHIDVPLTDAQAGTLRMTFNNSFAPVKVRACAFDTDGFQRVDQEFDVPVAPAHTIDLPVPRGAFMLVVQIQTPEGHGDLRSLIDPTICADHLLLKDFPIGRSTPPKDYEPRVFETNSTDPRHHRPTSSVWFGLRPATCAATGEVVEREWPDYEGSNGIDLGSLGGSPGLSLGSILTVAGFMTLGVAVSHPFTLGAVGLFTRLVRLKILDQPARSQIVELVDVRPGIRFHEIATTLGLGQGQALHHLRVLVTQRVLIRVGHAYFVAGKHGVAEMKSIVTLQEPTARAMYDALRPPEKTRVVDLARRMGVSPSWAAKVARKLESAGLVQRERVGRTCLVGALRKAATLPR